jgi:hypothetical protein
MPRDIYTSNRICFYFFFTIVPKKKIYFGIIKEDLFLRISCGVKILRGHMKEKTIISLKDARTFYTLLPFFMYHRFILFTMKFLSLY